MLLPKLLTVCLEVASHLSTLLSVEPDDSDKVEQFNSNKGILHLSGVDLCLWIHIPLDGRHL